MLVCFAQAFLASTNRDSMKTLLVPTVLRASSADPARALAPTAPGARTTADPARALATHAPRASTVNPVRALAPPAPRARTADPARQLAPTAPLASTVNQAVIQAVMKTVMKAVMKAVMAFWAVLTATMAATRAATNAIIHVLTNPTQKAKEIANPAPTARTPQPRAAALASLVPRGHGARGATRARARARLARVAMRERPLPPLTIHALAPLLRHAAQWGLPVLRWEEALGRHLRAHESAHSPSSSKA